MAGHRKQPELPILPGEGPRAPAWSCDFVLEFAADAILAVDEHDRIVLFNRSAQELFGYEAHEALGRPLDLLVPERFRLSHGERLAAFRTDEEGPSRMADARVVTMLHRDGSERPVEVSISKVPSRGSVLLSAIVRDATVRVRTESALKDRISHVQRLADALPVPVALVDRDQNFVFTNRTAAHWLGQDAQALAGTPVKDAVERVGSLETLDISREATKRVLLGEGQRFKTRARRADGSISHVEMILAPSRDESNVVDGYYVAMFDLTGGAWGKQASDLLTATGRLLEGSLDPDVTILSALDLMAAGFADEVVAFLGVEFARLHRYRSSLGDRPARVETSTWAEESAPVREAAMRGANEIFVDPEEGSHCLAIPLRFSRGAGGALLFRWRPPFHVGPGAIAVAHDLGSRLSNALERLELAARSREALQARDWLFQKVTHDLGNPVASIVMVADRLLRGANATGADARTRRLLEGIATQSREMALIIEELLAAASLRTGRATVVRRPVDAAAIVREALALAGPIAEFRGVVLEGDVPDEGLTALADPYHLRRALSALISEAIAWSEPGDNVSLRTCRHGDGVDFELRGPGSGVPDDELASLLDTDRASNGSDLAAWHAAGLALITGSELVRSHGSELRVETLTEKDRSYRFTLAAASSS
jgi:PAS domain S-box-containing protein